MRTSYKPVLALLGVILVVYFSGGLVVSLRRQAGATFEFARYSAGTLAITLLVGSLLVVLVAYLWSRPGDHRLAAWAFVIVGIALLIYPILRMTGVLAAFYSGPFLYSWVEIFFPGSAGALSAAIIAAAGVVHLFRSRN